MSETTVKAKLVFGSRELWDTPSHREELTYTPYIAIKSRTDFGGGYAQSPSVDVDVIWTGNIHFEEWEAYDEAHTHFMKVMTNLFNPTEAE